MWKVSWIVSWITSPLCIIGVLMFKAGVTQDIVSTASSWIQLNNAMWISALVIVTRPIFVWIVHG
jgi:hypothetical protein